MTSNDLISPDALAGKVILVTGGGRGLGKVMATMLAGYGAGLVLAGRTAADIEQTVGEIEAAGGSALAVEADVTNSGDVAKLADQILAEHGHIDVLVNNAGMNARNVNHKFEDIPEGEWDGMVDANLKSVFLTTQVIGKVMLGQGAGKIINIGSFFAMRGVPERICYGVTKAGIVNMTKALAAEWAGRGVTVNCFSPGSIDLFPERTDEAYLAEMKIRTSGIPLGRLGRMEELGPILAYLASDASDYMTGETITLDGGWLAQ
jgi:NAD(P)-dependent dehydrogenase (short-subunit alcohol dehydrogenase family)